MTSETAFTLASLIKHAYTQPLLQRCDLPFVIINRVRHCAALIMQVDNDLIFGCRQDVLINIRIAVRELRNEIFGECTGVLRDLEGTG